MINNVTYFQDLKDPQVRARNLVLAKRLNKIITITIEPTIICNLTCTYCDIQLEDNRPAPSSMSPEIMRAVINNIVNSHVSGNLKFQNVIFAGGAEPTVYKPLPEFVRALAHPAIKGKIFSSVRLITNGVLLTPALLDSLVSSGIEYVLFSLDSVDREEYKQLKGRDYLDRVLRNLSECISYIKKNKNVQLEIKALIPQDDERAETFKKVAHFFMEEARDSAFIHVGATPEYKYNDTALISIESSDNRNYICANPFQNMLIHQDGKISACCLEYFSKEELVIGDVTVSDSLETSIDWNKLNEIQRDMLNMRMDKLPVCKNCSYPGRSNTDMLSVKSELLDLVNRLQPQSNA